MAFRCTVVVLCLTVLTGVLSCTLALYCDVIPKGHYEYHETFILQLILWVQLPLLQCQRNRLTSKWRKRVIRIAIITSLFGEAPGKKFAIFLYTIRGLMIAPIQMQDQPAITTKFMLRVLVARHGLRISIPIHCQKSVRILLLQNNLII